jgi:6-phosphogluconate dehydrogenase
MNDKRITQRLISNNPSIKKVVTDCISNEVAIPNLSDVINFINAFAKEKSCTILIQTQRDYFGAHTYQLLDDKTGKFYHTL